MFECYVQMGNPWFPILKCILTPLCLYPCIQLFQIPPDYRNSAKLVVSSLGLGHGYPLRPCLLGNHQTQILLALKWGWFQVSPSTISQRDLDQGYWLLCDLMSGYTGCKGGDDDDDCFFYAVWIAHYIKSSIHHLTFTLSKLNQVIVGSKCNFSSTKKTYKTSYNFSKSCNLLINAMF